MIDLQQGAAVPTRDRLHALIETIRPPGEGIGAGAGLDHAHVLAESNGADRQRAVAGAGSRSVAALLRDLFLEGLE
jgi:hypothetical protein